MCVGTATLPCGEEKYLGGLECEEDEDEEEEDDDEEEEDEETAARAAAMDAAMPRATLAAWAADGEEAEPEPEPEREPPAAGDLCFLPPSAGIS